ncbi:MAG: LysR family transcriptional regulator [Lacticaseibacillus songhuajiangensis]|jgi:DNA-binding transcriptional LysR family regulator|nr:LysR family transcriptional regulator [Lacticaseibacillus songhuajiangensis]
MLKNLATFKMVYETRSFSQAARLLFIAQPTVSAQIKQLEAEFGRTLFIRNGRGELGITPAAEQLYDEAVKLLDGWEELHRRLNNGAAARMILRIASSHTFAATVLPQILPELVARFPQLDVHVTVVNSQAVVTGLLNHSLDVGFIEKPLVAPKLRRHTLGADQLVLVENPGPWLVREVDSGVNYFTKRYFAEHNVQEPQLEIANNALIVDLLRRGYGRAIVSSRLTGGLAQRDLGPNYRRQFYQLLPETSDKPQLDGAGAFLAKAAQQLLQAHMNHAQQG